MRRITLAALVLLGALFSVATHVPAGASSAVPTLKQCKTLVKKELFQTGHLTIATDNPVDAPWFIKNTPSNGLGFESALSYSLASELGFTPKQVKWTTEHYTDSYQPGAKSFDFDINEIVYNSTWASNVATSSAYYQVSQSLVAMKSDPIVKRHTAKQLTTYVYGALDNSPAMAYVLANIKPTKTPLSFDSLQDAINALTAGTIDALAIDTPTGHLVATNLLTTSEGAPLATQFAQFAPNGDEYYIAVLQKGNPLATCVSVAVAADAKSGTLRHLEQKWLTVYNAVPVIRP